MRVRACACVWCVGVGVCARAGAHARVRAWRGVAWRMAASTYVLTGTIICETEVHVRVCGRHVLEVPVERPLRPNSGGPYPTAPHDLLPPPRRPVLSKPRQLAHNYALCVLDMHRFELVGWGFTCACQNYTRVMAGTDSRPQFVVELPLEG